MDDEREFEKKEKVEKQQTQIDIVDPKDASKDILTKCNIIKKKNPVMRNLKKGEGHLSMSEAKVADIYQNVVGHPIGLRSSF